MFTVMNKKGIHNMKRALDFLKECGVFYLATVDGDRPRVRPFGAVCGYEGKLYLITSNKKDVYAQIMKNPKVEISGMAGGDWIRLDGELERDPSRDAKKAMLDENESLRSMYSEDDGIMEVLFLKNAEATVCSFTKPPESWTF